MNVIRDNAVEIIKEFIICGAVRSVAVDDSLLRFSADQDGNISVCDMFERPTEREYKDLAQFSTFELVKIASTIMAETR